MKQALLAALCLVLCSPLLSQFYMRGEVRDDKGQLLAGVKITLSSKSNTSYYSGNAGAFGIPSLLAIDTINLELEGYESLKKAVQTTKYQSLVMKMLPGVSSFMKNSLTSRTKNLTVDKNSLPSVAGESYSYLVENEFVNASQYPETGFALNVDRASYSNTRRFLSNEMNVPPDAVRIEEMLNYFDFRDPKDTIRNKDFICHTTLSTCPWNPATQLLFVHLDAPRLNLDKVPPSNLVFLIDVSGSMERPNRLPLLQSAFKLLVENLRPIDTVSIVTYGGHVAVVLSSTGGAEKQKINNIIDSLVADGDTPGEGAIRTAYSIAKRNFVANGNNRVILATDGDFNVGQSTEKELEDLITLQRASGIYLTCIGVGMGNYKDSKLEALAKKGNGNFAYLDNIREGEKVLVTEFTKTVYAVADDASLNVSFDPAVVKDYRLIGFDNKKQAISDHTSELEGGEIGSGHSVMAVFEITPQKDVKADSSVFAKLNLQYRLPGTDSVLYRRFSVPYSVQPFDKADSSIRFATSVVMFGSLLKKSKFTKNDTYLDVLNLARSASGKDNYLQQEFITLVQKAEKIYNYKKKKK